MQKAREVSDKKISIFIKLWMNKEKKRGFYYFISNVLNLFMMNNRIKRIMITTQYICFYILGFKIGKFFFEN